MLEPKITKFKGGYSADTELLFRSWCTYILSNIQDCELDNKAAIQLIKDMTAESAHHEGEFNWTFVAVKYPIRTYLNISVLPFKVEVETNLSAEFYSHGQKAKEKEGAFADELQIVAHR